MLLGHSDISADSKDVAARLISERQVRDLRDAWIAGPQSSIWRAAIFQLAGELVDAATAAERALADAVTPTSPQGLDDDAPGAAEVGEALEHFGEESERLVSSLAGVLPQIPEILANPQRLADLDEVLEGERASVEGAEGALAPIVEVEGYLADFLEQLRPLEVISAPMRNSVRGSREASRAIQGGIAIMRSWPKIADEN